MASQKWGSAIPLCGRPKAVENGALEASDPILPKLFIFLNYAFAVTFMFGIGLRTEESAKFNRGLDRGLVLRVLLANVVLVPAVAWVIHRLLPMPHELALGFMLVAITPGGLFGIHFCHLAKGDTKFSVQLAFLLALAATFLVPLIASVLLPISVSARFLDLRILVEMLLLALLPLFLGMVARRLLKAHAKPVGRVLGVLNMVIFGSQELLGTQLKKISMDFVGHETLLAFVLLIIVSWALGWIMAGRNVGQRKVLAIDTSMRNVAICWLLVHRSFAGPGVAVAILAFNGIAVPMNFGFALLTRFFVRETKETK